MAEFSAEIYGGTALPDALKVDIEARAPQQPLPVQQNVPVSSAVLGSASALAGESASAGSMRPTSTFSETSLATADEFLATKGIKALFEGALDAQAWELGMPTYVPEPPEVFNKVERFKELPYALETSEQEFLLKAVSNSDWNTRVQKIQQHHDNIAAMGDHVAYSMFVGAGDPAYFGIGSLSMGSARLVGTSRLLQAGVGGTTGLALTAGAYKGIEDYFPVEPAHMYIDMLLNTAAGTLGGAVQAGRTGARAAARSAQVGADAVHVNPAFPSEPMAQQLLAAKLSYGTPVSELPITRLITGRADEATPVIVRRGALATERSLMNADKLEASIARTTESFENLKLKREALARTGAELAEVRTTQPVGASITTSTASRITQLEAERALQLQSIAENIREMQGLRKVQGALEFDSTFQRVEYQQARLASIQAEVQAYQELLEEIPAGAGVSTELAHTVTMLERVQRTIQQDVDTILIRQPELNTRAGAPGIAELTSMQGAPAAGSNTPPVRVTAMAARVEAPTSSTLTLAPEPVAIAATDAINAMDNKTFGKKFADKLYWNINNTMRRWSPRVADVMTDNNSNLGQHSVESIVRGIRGDLKVHQTNFNQMFMKEMAQRGTGLWQMATRWSKSINVQKELSKELRYELLQRELAATGGTPQAHGLNPRINALADQHQVVMNAALRESKLNGVLGAEHLNPVQGWMHRIWNPAAFTDAIDTMVKSGLSNGVAKQVLQDTLAKALVKANPHIPMEVIDDIAKAIQERALRRGEVIDPLFYTHQGSAITEQIRSMLRDVGLSELRQAEILKVLTGATDEAGKPGFLKHRLDIDYNTSVALPDGRTLSVMDLIDYNVPTLMDKYLDGVAGAAGWARKGYKTPGAIQALKEELVQGAVRHGEAKAAATMFDNVLAQTMGGAVGGDMAKAVRFTLAWTRAVGLGNGGILQVSEFATMAAHWGVLKTTKAVLQEMPIARKLFSKISKDADYSTRAHDVLTRMSYNEVRLKPYLARFEDGFDIPMQDKGLIAAGFMQQLVPYVNLMKHIQRWQANTASNLIMDAVEQAVKGNKQYISKLKKYGMTEAQIKGIGEELRVHGPSIDKWAAGAWESYRPAFYKMMDESVLKARMGDVPAFAVFDPLGKFIFTFRSFVLTAHNKILAGTAARDGLGVVGLMMMYQFPLALMVAKAIEVKDGHPPSTMSGLASKAIGNAGALGLFTEMYGVLSGDKQQFGSPGLIAIDNSYKAIQLLKDGKLNKAASATIGLTPLVSIAPGIKFLRKHLETSGPLTDVTVTKDSPALVKAAPILGIIPGVN